MGFVSGQEFNELPDGVITDFTTATAFVGNIIVTQGGLVVYAFEYVDDRTIRFAEAPVAADGDLRWAGYIAGSPEGTLSTFLAGIMDRIQDEESKLDTAALTGCLQAALKEYSQRRPRRVAADQSGSGTALMDVPATWEADSDLLHIDALNASSEPDPLSRSSYRLIMQPGGTYELFNLDGTWSSSTTYRLHYTLIHTVEADSTSVPASHQEALMDLGASYALLRMAAAYAQSTDPQINTVTLDYKSKANEYRTLARDYRQQYEHAMKSGAKPGTGKMKTWQREQTLLFHR